MLDFGGQTLLQRQLNAYKKNEINDIFNLGDGVKILQVTSDT